MKPSRPKFLFTTAMTLFALSVAVCAIGASSDGAKHRSPKRKAIAQYTIDVGPDFSPSTIRVKKGVPVRLNFRRSSKPTCASSVTFPTLGITRVLSENKTTAIDITPKKSGDLTFACGMGMMQGKLVVE